MPIYCYKVNKTNDVTSFSLLHILLSQSSLGNALNKSRGYVRFVLENQNGWIKESIYLTKTPIINNKINTNFIVNEIPTMDFSDFVNYVKSLLNKKSFREGYSVTVVDAKTNINLGTYPSISYVSKYIIKGANRHALKIACNQGKLYNGYYLYSNAY